MMEYISECPSGKYGYGCKQTCSDNCIDSKCNKTDGKCLNGCNDGRHGDRCGNGS